jgi:hypothetical protein
MVELSTDKFPDSKNFLKALRASEAYWGHIAAAKKFFRSAIRVLQAPKLRMLKVSDFNTTGLLGDVNDRTADWFKLTKAVGASDKSALGVGSFGIGKHAPFANSELRTVFYGTKDKTGKFAFQGVTKLVTHENGKGQKTQGNWYYGEKTRNQPILRASDVDSMFKRTKVGTDVFIMGFPKIPDWADQIAKALIDSFFVAIFDGRLVARVGTLLINKESLPELIAKFSKDNPGFAAAAYFEAMTSDDAENAHTFQVDDFEGLGSVELRVLTNKTFPKRIAMVRSGMKIWDKGHFQTPVRFAGVLRAKGEGLNAFLKSLEPPMHDHWEANRADDPAAAKATVRHLYGWINDAIKSLSAAGDIEELDAEGMSQYLPDDLDDTPATVDSTGEGLKARPLPELPVIPRTYDKPHTTATGRTSLTDNGEDYDASGGDGFGGGDGPGGGDGGGGGVEPGGGGGPGETKSPSSIGQSGPATRPIGLKNVRVFCSDPDAGRYRILFEPEAKGSGYLTVRVIGEVGEEPAPIKYVVLPGKSKEQAPAGDGKVGPLNFAPGKRVALDVVLENALHCALGVAAHAS